jgi:sporulation protein YlmC with PRC-barrel domain
MDLVRDLLDKQLVSVGTHTPMGMVDDVVLELGDGGPPRVVVIESGFPALARRVHPRLERLVRAAGRRWGVRKGRVLRIPWSRVYGIGIEISLRLNADRCPTTAWEQWLRERVLVHIPGGHK